MEKFDKSIFKDLNILYVEDDAMTSEEISFFLKKYVKNLYIAKNGKEGLALFENNKIDMVITDIQMPTMNGLEMSKRILQIDPSIPIAITTAYSDGDFIMNAIELGIDKYIVKPINMQEILGIIQKSVNQVNSLNKDVYYKDYIKFILESNPTFMFVLQSEEIEYVNNKFLELVGEDDINSFKRHLKNFNDLFELNDNSNENWVEYIVNNDENTHLVKLKNPKSEEFSNISFYVKYKKFNDINKSVFVFVDSNEEKLKQINEISKNILDNDEYDKNFFEDIEKINHISNLEYFKDK